MSKRDLDVATPRLAGYAALVERFGLEVIPNWHTSRVALGGTHRVESADGVVVETYPSRCWPGEQPGDHLEFALRYDGTNLALLAVLFEVIPQEDVLACVTAKPTGKYARRLWFLYEWLTGRRLPIDDLTRGNYFDLLDPDEYYTTATPQPARRQRINNNLLGDKSFCPMVRRTETLGRLESADLPGRCQKIVTEYPPQLLKRAMSYLYTKETQSSFEIEHITPDSTRMERFVALLQSAQSQDFCQKARLIELQNHIVNPHFHDTDYRKRQNYVGLTLSFGYNQRQKVHYVCPKPEDLADLMAGLLAAHKRMSDGQVSPVIHAAAVAYGFVFLHPFEDGNGRIHRFLIHNILTLRGFTPKGIIFPVSAVMVKHMEDYDASLEAFSQPLMTQVNYTLDNVGHMTVHNDTAALYRYIDMTAQVEALFGFIEKTIDTELTEELTFLANYDRTRKALQEIVDMPNRQLDLFIQFCLQNHGKLSAKKRASHFDFLSDTEVARMEQAVQEGYESRVSDDLQ